MIERKRGRYTQKKSERKLEKVSKIERIRERE